MKATVSAAALAGALKRSVTPRASTNPILKCALLEAADDRLRLVTTDLERELTTHIDASVKKPGKCAVDSALLRGLASRLAGDIELSATKTRLSVTQEGRRYALESLPVDDWPSAHIDAGEALAIDSAVLADAIDRVSVAMGVDDTRYYLNGIFIGRDQVVATNGISAAIVTTETGSGEVIVPAAAIAALGDLLETDGVTVTTAKGANHESALVASVADREQFVTRLIDGKYPDMARVTPASFSGQVVLPAEDVRAACARLALSAERQGFTSPVDLVAGGDHIEMKNAIGVERVECVGDGGADVCFDLNQLQKIVRAITSESIVWKFNKANEAQVFAPSDRDNLIYILMPVRR